MFVGMDWDAATKGLYFTVVQAGHNHMVWFFAIACMDYSPLLYRAGKLFLNMDTEGYHYGTESSIR